MRVQSMYGAAQRRLERSAAEAVDIDHEFRAKVRVRLDAVVGVGVTAIVRELVCATCGGPEYRHEGECDD